eukprot:408308-Pleurochrysis_carterae.AAC.1
METACRKVSALRLTAWHQLDAKHSRSRISPHAPSGWHDDSYAHRDGCRQAAYFFHNLSETFTIPHHRAGARAFCIMCLSCLQTRYASYMYAQLNCADTMVCCTYPAVVRAQAYARVRATAEMPHCMLNAHLQHARMHIALIPYCSVVAALHYVFSRTCA